MRDANPVIFLVPGVGMLSFARDKATARIASEFYVNAINVMRGSSTVSEYQGLPEQEAFDIEYWLLEEAKLQRMPKPKSAGRQGRLRYRWRRRHRPRNGCTSRRRGRLRGACRYRSRPHLRRPKPNSCKSYGADAVRAVKLDVTEEDGVDRLFRRLLR